MIRLLFLAALTLTVLNASPLSMDQILNHKIAIAKREVESCANSPHGAKFSGSGGGCPFAGVAARFHHRYKRTTHLLKSQTMNKEVLERVLRQLSGSEVNSILNGIYGNSSNSYNPNDPSSYDAIREEVASRLDHCSNQKKAAKPAPDPPCGKFDKTYSRINGECNNLRDPIQARAGSIFKRILPPYYDDGFDSPVGWTNKKFNGFELPSPREVTVEVMTSFDPKKTLSDIHTTMNFQWGQFVDHDITETPISKDQICATTCEQVAPCFPIKVPANEVAVRNKKCIPFSRSTAVCGDYTVREQFNQLTAIIDAGNVYGFSDDVLETIRDKKDRKYLKVEDVTENGGKPLPPKDKDLTCTSSGGDGAVPCRHTGDERANDTPALLTMHTLFVREHNRIARELARLNPYDEPELIFQKTRKIIAAIHQHITYKHWLSWMIKNPPKLVEEGYSKYDSKVDPTIVSEFSTACFRSAHATLPFTLDLLDKNYDGTLSENSRNFSTLFEATKLVEEGLDPFLRSLMIQPVKITDPKEMVSSEVVNHLFGTDDLAARNLQRGRDHGIQFYAAYLRKFGFIDKKLKSFDDLKDIITNRRVRNKLKKVYRDPENIELFVGGLAETKEDDSGIVGPLFDKIITDQFQRIMDGDRFFYTHYGVFTPQQLESIRKVTLARIICDNSDGSIDRVPENVFLITDPAAFKCCTDIPILDLTPWKCETKLPPLHPPPKDVKLPGPQFAGHWEFYNIGRQQNGNYEKRENIFKTKEKVSKVEKVKRSKKNKNELLRKRLLDLAKTFE